ncbi:MAG TPA: phenylalanyl-tRNA synthetase subunit alpha [Pelobium sp.]
MRKELHEFSLQLDEQFDLTDIKINWILAFILRLFK